MSVFFLNGYSGLDPDVNCPHCHQGFTIDWQEDPTDCDEFKNCPACNKKIIVRVSVEVHTRDVKPIEKDST